MVDIVGIDEKEVFQRTCKNCASILRFTRSETVMKKHTDLGGVTEFYDIIECPKCGNHVEV